MQLWTIILQKSKLNDFYLASPLAMSFQIGAQVDFISLRPGWTPLRLLLVWLAVLITVPCSAETIELGTADKYIAGPYIAYLKDTDKNLSFAEIQQPEIASKFVANTSAVPSFGFSDAAYWFRLRLQNRHPTRSEWMIEIPSAMFWSAPYYIVKSDGSIEHGMIRHQGEAGFTSQAHRTPVFSLDLPPQQEVTLYFRVEEKGSLRLPLTVWTPTAFVAADHDYQFVHGILFGVLLAMLAYNLLLFISLRNKNYAWYVCYVGTFNLALASFLGYGKENLWPAAAWWSSLSTLVCAALTMVFGIIFAQSFLQTRKVLPRLHRALSVVAWWELAMIPALAWFGRGHFLNGAILAGCCAGAILMFATGLAALRAHVREARFFVVAWAAFLISVVLICAEYLGLIPVSDIPSSALKVCGALEGLLLSLALADRLQMLKRSRSILRQLGVRQERVREDQRKQIARDIHDTLGQNLLALRMDVDQLQSMSKGVFPRMDETVDRILAQIDSVVKSVRAIMNSLRPAMLDDLGLHAAIEWQIQEFQARSGIVCELVSEGEGLDRILDEYRATALFRSLQDALNNVFPQAHAKRIEIGLYRRGGNLVMNMTDPGARAAFDDNAQASTISLAGMRERLAALGGEFKLQSDPHHGLRLTILLPLQEQDMQELVA